MKVYKWIDKYNYKVSLRIIQKYNLRASKSKTALIALHSSLLVDYILRTLLVFSSIILIKKSAYKTFYQNISRKSSPFFSRELYPFIYIKLGDLISTFFGHQYFVEKETSPLLDNNTILSRHIILNYSKNPFLHIIVHEVSRLDYLYNCLKSLKDNISEKYPIDILVINDGRDQYVNTFLETNVKGVTIHKAKELSASIIQKTDAELICLISSDTQIKKNYLECLIQALKSTDVRCAVGKAISKNGLIFYAGKFEDPGHPDLNYQKGIEIQHSKNIMFYKDGFTGSGLTDEARRKTLYQPLSEMICFSAKNKNVFTEISTKQTRQTILFIDDVIPTPDQDSGSNRIFKIMQLVKTLGFHVIFLPNNGQKTSNYFDQMISEGFEVLYRFPNRQGMIQILMDRLNRIDMVWLCKPHNNEQFKLIFMEKKALRWIYDTIDLHFLRLQREGLLSKNKDVIQSSNAIKNIELDLARRADVTIAITNEEKEILEKELINNVFVIPNIHEIELAPKEAENPFLSRNGLLFIGGYLHKPNIDAALWLVHEIMPLIWNRDPSITITLLGSSPTKEILALQSDRVIVPGYIHDVSPYFNNSRVFVAPLRFGAGMKGKIGQSLEFGLPIVSTDIGVEGIGLKDGYDVMVANEVGTFAEKIMQLYTSPELWTKIKNNSANVLKQYSPEAVKQKLDNLLRHIGRETR